MTNRETTEYQNRLSKYTGTTGVPVDQNFRDTQRERAEELGVTQRDIARRLDLSAVWISKVWNEHEKGTATWHKIAALLDLVEAEREKDMEE